MMWPGPRWTRRVDPRRSTSCTRSSTWIFWLPRCTRTGWRWIERRFWRICRPFARRIRTGSCCSWFCRPFTRRICTGSCRGLRRLITRSCRSLSRLMSRSERSIVDSKRWIYRCWKMQRFFRHPWINRRDFCREWFFSTRWRFFRIESRRKGLFCRGNRFRRRNWLSWSSRWWFLWIESRWIGFFRRVRWFRCCCRWLSWW